MRKLKSVLISAVIIILLVFCLMNMKFCSKAFETKVDSTFLEDKINGLGEVSLVDRKYTTPELQFEDTFLFSTKKLVLVYQGELKLGFDAEEVEVDLNDETKTVVVYIPEIKIISHEIDPENIRVVYEENGWWNNIKPNDALKLINKNKEKTAKAEIDEHSERATKEFKEMISSVVAKFTPYPVTFIQGEQKPKKMPENEKIFGKSESLKL